MASSSSATRAFSASGSKVITDPGKLGPDFLQLLVERKRRRLGHAGDGTGLTRDTSRPEFRALVHEPWIGAVLAHSAAAKVATISG